MIRRSERLGKFSLNQIVPDKKGVGTNEITAHQAVAELVAQPLEGLEACPEVVSEIPPAMGSVLNLPLNIRRDVGIVLNDHNPWHIRM